MGSAPPSVPRRRPAREPSARGRLLRNRNFLSLLVGVNLSGWGDAIFDLAIMWYVYTGTGSALQTAGVEVARRISYVVIGPLAGTFVDRWDRRRTMMVTDAVRLVVVLAVGVLALRNELLPAVAFAAVFLLHGAARFFVPAREALMRRIVDRDDLVPANGLYTAVGQGNGFLATSAAGAIVAALGAAWSIVADAVSFAFSILGVAGVRLPADAVSVRGGASASPPARGGARARRSFVAEVMAGLRFCWRDPVLRGITVLALTGTAGAAAAPAVLPALVHLQLHAGATVYGFMLGGTMVGSFIGGVSAGWIERRLSLGRVFVLSLVAFGLAFVCMGLSSSVVVSVCLFAITSLASTLLSVPFAALFQARVPDEYMGRASSFLGAVEASAAPVSVLLGGWLADASSPAVVFIAAGAWVTVTAGLVLANPHLRNVRVSAAGSG